MLSTRKKSVLGTAVGLSLVINGAVLAAPGDLDLGFGAGGKVLTDFGSDAESAYDAAVQWDGKIVVVGHTYNETNSVDIAITRYNTDGSLDLSFGTGGKIITDSGDSDVALAVAIQYDGKIVIAGYYGGTSAIVRYFGNGALDSGFGAGGVITIPFTSVRIADLAVQFDNKIIAVGQDWSTGGDFFLTRLNTNGRLDHRFGKNGKVVTDFSGFDDYASGIALQADGKIVVAGYAYTSGAGFDVALARYTLNGRLDSSFGSGGKVVTNVGNDEVAHKLVVQRDGKIVVVGASGIMDSVSVIVDGDFLLARYQPNGNLDTSFGVQGMTLTDFNGTTDNAEDVKIDRNGRYVVAGWTQDVSTGAYRFGVARYLSNGNIDSEFGIGGKVITHFGGDHSQAYAIVVQPDNKIVAAGGAVLTEGDDFSIARYLP